MRSQSLIIAYFHNALFIIKLLKRAQLELAHWTDPAALHHYSVFYGIVFVFLCIAQSDNSEYAADGRLCTVRSITPQPTP